MNKYKKFRESRQKDFNRITIIFALTEDSFQKQLASKGLTETDILHIGCGAFIPKSEKPILEEHERKYSLEERMEDKDFRVDAFLCEMRNYEYGINSQGDFDVLNVFAHGKLKNEYGLFYKDFLCQMGHLEWVDSYEKAKKLYYQGKQGND